MKSFAGWIAVGILATGMLPGFGTSLPCGRLAAQTPDDLDPVVDQETLGRRYAVLVVGLPGDEAHREDFDRISSAWRDWLVDKVAVDATDVWHFSGKQAIRGNASDGTEPERATLPGTRKSLEEQLAGRLAQLKPEDALWVFFLGHANYDDEHAWFHLPGPDVNEYDVGQLFRDVSCREQVFWMTHTCSGWFLEPLSRQGRIVITATLADREVNETEFPLALTQVIKRPLGELDSDEDQQLSVAELWIATSREVERLFAADQRAATEHALLDDNGDGHGTEVAEVIKALQPDVETETDPEPASVVGRVKPADGRVSAGAVIPIQDRSAPDDDVPDDDVPDDGSPSGEATAGEVPNDDGSDEEADVPGGLPSARFDDN